MATIPWTSNCRVPLEIFCVIINLIDSHRTLERCCEATKGYQNLFQVCLQARYKIIGLDARDIITESDEPLPSTNSKRWRVERLVMPMETEPFKQSPAAYITKLRLDFAFSPPEDTENKFQVTCCEDIQYTLSTLLPQCISLQEIRHSGNLYQENLDIIKNLVNLPIRSLRLRLRRGYFGTRWRNPPTPLYEDEEYRLRFDRESRILRWDDLYQMFHLRRLEIGELIAEEGDGLAQSVEKLENLERLLIQTVHLPPWEFDHGAPSRLQRFFNYIFGSDSEDPGCRLPCNLKSLVLCDAVSRNATISPLSPLSTPTAYPHLVDLFLDFDNLSALQTLFSRIHLPTLQRLAIPASINIPEQNAIYFLPRNEEEEEPDPDYPVYLALINQLIKKHQPTLNQITLLNAWQLGQLSSHNNGTVRELQHNWSCAFKTRELVLGTQSPDMLPDFHDANRFPPPTENHLNHNFYIRRSYIPGPRWGNDLLRLRIDRVNLQNLLVRNFAIPDLAFLKILILHPFRDEILPYHTNPPEDLSQFQEGRIALALADQEFPNLQIIMIGEYKFWVEHVQPNNKAKRYRKVWYYSKAFGNEIQRAEIFNNLNARDWAFMRDWQGINLPLHLPSSQMFRHRSFMVLTKEEDGKGGCGDNGESMRHEMEFMDMWSFAGGHPGLPV